MKVALVHDYLNQLGGAEKVLAALAEIFPSAPIYTLLCDPKRTRGLCDGRRIYTSPLQRLPFVGKWYERYLPFFPFFVEQLDLSGYDLVISDSSAWAKGVLTFPPTCHISYVHTPMRFAWDYYYATVNGMSRIVRPALRTTITYLRMWDVVATRRVDFLACNSRAVQARILKYYGRYAEVIPPPVATDFYTPAPNGGPGPLAGEKYFVTVCRLKPYKRVDIAVAGFKGLPYRLVVIGDGPRLKSLQAEAPPNVQFVTKASDEVVREYLRYAEAFIITACEDFGIAPVEAMACGRPVIAFRGGGAVDTVIENVTGLFFNEQSPRALREVILAFDARKFDAVVIRSHAVRYDTNRFKARFAEFAWSSYEKFRRRFRLTGRAATAARDVSEKELFERVPAASLAKRQPYGG